MQQLDSVAMKLEELEESFNHLSGKLVSFMVQSMIAIYDALDKKNADKVYNILAKESIECLNIELECVSPPLSPAPSVDTSVSPILGRINSQTNKDTKTTRGSQTNIRNCIDQENTHVIAVSETHLKPNQHFSLGTFVPARN